MRRREFIALMASAAAWPLAARAQQVSPIPTVGLLAPGNPASHGHRVTAFVRRLNDLGWTEGRTVVVEYRWADGRRERFSQIAAEFAQRKVDVIVTAGTEAVIEAKKVTNVIPIVFATTGDPVGAGLVASLARPGGNVTGLSMQQTDAAGKRLELLRELIPDLKRLAVLANVSNPSVALEVREIQAMAGAFGVEIILSEIRNAGDITPAVERLKNRAEALYVGVDPILTTNRVRISTLAIAARLPTVHLSREFVEAGGLMSYGPNSVDLYQRAAKIVDKILRGTKPTEIPIEQATKFDLIINLTTARALGLALAPMLLARADEVIE